jgi:hypothetical protein
LVLENLHCQRGVTCVAVRLFLRPSDTITHTLSGLYKETQAPPDLARAMRESPVVVCGPRILPQLAEKGFRIYNLQRLVCLTATSVEGLANVRVSPLVEAPPHLGLAARY